MLNINYQKLKFQPLCYSYPKIGIVHVEAAGETGVDYGVLCWIISLQNLVTCLHKALSAFGRSFPWLIQTSLESSSPVIQVNLK